MSQEILRRLDEIEHNKTHPGLNTITALTKEDDWLISTLRASLAREQKLIALLDDLEFELRTDPNPKGSHVVTIMAQVKEALEETSEEAK